MHEHVTVMPTLAEHVCILNTALKASKQLNFNKYLLKKRTETTEIYGNFRNYSIIRCVNKMVILSEATKRRHSSKTTVTHNNSNDSGNNSKTEVVKQNKQRCKQKMY